MRGSVAEPYDRAGCATLISDTGSGRLPSGSWRGSAGCRRKDRFWTARRRLERDDLGAYQRAVERLGQLIQQAQQLTEAPPPSTNAQAANPP